MTLVKIALKYKDFEYGKRLAIVLNRDWEVIYEEDFDDEELGEGGDFFKNKKNRNTFFNLEDHQPHANTSDCGTS